MATFQYKAYTARGAVTAGTIVAEGLDAAIDALYGSGLTPFETYGVADQTVGTVEPVIGLVAGSGNVDLETRARSIEPLQPEGTDGLYG